MYKISPYIDNSFRVPLSQCMYKVNNYHTLMSGEDSGNMGENYGQDDQKNLKEIPKSHEEIYRRQEKILEQLESMKNELAELAKKIGFTFKPALHKSEVPEKVHDLQLPCDPFYIVISSEPTQPPVVAFLFYHILKEEGYIVSSPVHLHSSLEKPVEEKWLSCLDRVSALRQGRKQVVMTFIWRKDPFGPSLTVSPRTGTDIKGANNIARYFARLFKPSLYEDCISENVAAIDGWLDGAILQVFYGSKKEKSAAIRRMNAQLGKSTWLTGDMLTLADLCAWSAVVGDESLIAELPKNVKRWFNHCVDSQPFNKITEALGLKDLL